MALSRAGGKLTSREDRGAAIAPWASLLEMSWEYGLHYSQFGIRGEQALSSYLLRDTADKTPPIRIAVNMRRAQCVPYCKPTVEEDRPGFRILLRDRERRPNSTEKKESARLQDFFLHGGFDENWEQRDDDLVGLTGMIVEDLMILDKATVEFQRNRSGEIIAPIYVDPGTIRRVYEGGPSEEIKHQIRPDLVYYPNKDYEKIIGKIRGGMIPANVRDIKYVQVNPVHNMEIPHMAYTAGNLSYFSLNPASDIRWRGLGRSVMLQMIHIIAGLLNALAFHIESCTSSRMPKIALAVPGMSTDRAEMDRVQERFRSFLSGPKGMQGIPIITSDAKVLDLFRSARDNEFRWLMEFLMSLVGGLMRTDFIEIGLKLNQQTQAMTEGSGRGRQQHSRDIGLTELLLGMERWFSRWLKHMDREDFIFDYTGISPEDRELIDKLKTAASKRDRTVNEIREKDDQEPLEYGDVILDPVYMQWVQMNEQKKQQAAFNDVSSAIDEAFEEAPGVG